MYRIFTSNKKVEKRLNRYISEKKSINLKLDRLKENPYNNCGAHPLHGVLKGKWACWLGSNIRIVYVINEREGIIFIEDAGSHKVY
ncbi:MAG: type II toxin-antitoxin system mRNA interferase toxin, RelE/StbE family [Nanoarchaeota archaeon]|nr:type II toxin-antitoxin system mRNA interferase toxin, RelE/StbE family [Nanoarchaeota archaeon]MBU1501583.1 type II toxin-antitoxin system mRNA interferase toxin, RelE/StbE family [Nanoarchaeota archaeon]